MDASGVNRITVSRDTSYIRSRLKELERKFVTIIGFPYKGKRILRSYPLHKILNDLID